MKQIKITHNDIELLDFVSSRLLYYKRIDLDILLQVLTENFPEQNAVHVLRPLLDEKVIRIENDHLVPLNAAALKQLLLGVADPELRCAHGKN